MQVWPKSEAGKKVDVTQVWAPRMEPEARYCKWEQASNKRALRTSFKGKEISSRSRGMFTEDGMHRLWAMWAGQLWVGAELVGSSKFKPQRKYKGTLFWIKLVGVLMRWKYKFLGFGPERKEEYKAESLGGRLRNGKRTGYEHRHSRRPTSWWVLPMSN